MGKMKVVLTPYTREGNKKPVVRRPTRKVEVEIVSEETKHYLEVNEDGSGVFTVSRKDRVERTVFTPPAGSEEMVSEIIHRKEGTEWATTPDPPPDHPPDITPGPKEPRREVSRKVRPEHRNLVRGYRKNP